MFRKKIKLQVINKLKILKKILIIIKNFSKLILKSIFYNKTKCY